MPLKKRMRFLIDRMGERKLLYFIPKETGFLITSLEKRFGIFLGSSRPLKRPKRKNGLNFIYNLNKNRLCSTTCGGDLQKIFMD